MDHVAAYGASARYDVHRTNVIEEPPGPVDWLICVELLEHLEVPLLLVQALRKMLAPGGKAFIATAINAPNSDHIYLFRSVDEVVEMLRMGGFTVEEVCANAAEGPKYNPPTVAAFIVR
jgi:2-polyprenyl-3-methyl-5-hydroxy-6-metoxy-1,4-benzoquinol methylase